MALTLAQLKQAFKKTEGEQSNLPNNYYPFWNMKDGESATVRFLPDKNVDNPLGFVVEKLMHNLDINGERKSVACLKMYEEECPICAISSAYYKKEDKVNGKKYWRNKQYIVQALIVEDPLPANETTGEKFTGKVRNLTLGYQIYNVIKEAFESGELDEIPYAYKNGCDFIIKKTKQGEYSTYAVGSRFARKTSDLTEEQLAVVNESLLDLATLLPKHPGREKVQGMLEAALTGASAPATTTKTSSKAAASQDDETSDDVPVTTAATVETSASEDGADDILKQIRARRQAAAQ